jgi:hypothetical protein
MIEKNKQIKNLFTETQYTILQNALSVIVFDLNVLETSERGLMIPVKIFTSISS